MNTKKTPPQESNINTGTIESFVNIPSKVYRNLSQEVIITTEDKVKLCLIEHLKKMENKKEWLIPLGILIPLIITLKVDRHIRVSVERRQTINLHIFSGKLPDIFPMFF